MIEPFSLKDQLFNEGKIDYLSGLLVRADSSFDGAGFRALVMSRLLDLELMQRIDWIADCLTEVLPADFNDAAHLIEACLPPPLNPDKTDDDFGDFIFAPFGEYVARHGLDQHFDRSLDLLEALTQRFSMEFAIRSFLNHRPGDVLERMRAWAEHPNYHVRRLVSEGTRPKLPWGKKIVLDPQAPLPLLDLLYGDKTRFVTRSVANHLNDISKTDAALVCDTLERWRGSTRQVPGEMGWITSHALRTLVKRGDRRALELLGYHADAPVRLASLSLADSSLKIGETLEIEAELESDEDTPVLVDFLIWYHRPNGREASKVFKLKQARVQKGKTLRLAKRYRLKGNATTFTLHPGPHRLSLQVNGRILGEVEFQLCE